MPKTQNANQDGKGLVAFFSHHKCGTTYYHRVLTDIAKRYGLTYAMFDNPSQFGEDLSKVVAANDIDIIAYMNADYSWVAPLQQYRGVHILRDPRDVIVSGYFSHLKSHPTDGWQALGEYRQRLQSVDKAQGLLLEMDFARWTFRCMREWRYEDSHILTAHFEEVLTNAHAFWKRAFDFVFTPDGATPPTDDLQPIVYHFNGFELPLAELLEIVDEHSFQRLTEGRKPGEENANHHFRKGVAGDWKNHFNEYHVNVFKQRFGNLLTELGYETTSEWAVSEPAEIPTGNGSLGDV